MALRLDRLVCQLTNRTRGLNRMLTVGPTIGRSVCLWALVAVSSTAMAVTPSAGPALSVADVNAKVTDLVKPLNSATSKVSFGFKTLKVDDVRTLDFSFTSLFEKKGSQNNLKFRVKNASYAYGDGAKPTVDVDLDFKIDFVKLLGQYLINRYADDIVDWATSFVNDSTQDYGSAATVSAQVLNKKVDAKGDVNFLKVKLGASVDFSKLPASMPASEVELQGLNVVFVMTRGGLALKAKLVMNPAYKGFDPGQDGLKEVIEKLLSDDASIYDELQTYLATIDSLTTWLVESKP